MEPRTNETKWYALYTKPRWEKKVAEDLTQRKIENYCPINKVVRQWSDRKKIVLEPLFTSYVFVKTTDKMFSEIRSVRGVINLVYWLSKPAAIRNEEIDCIKNFLRDYDNVKLEKIQIHINDTVRVMNGLLMEYEGNVIAIKSETVKIALPSLGYMMIAEIEKSNLKIINPIKPYNAITALQ